MSAQATPTPPAPRRKLVWRIDFDNAPRSNAAYILYLLHANAPAALPRHYLGITTPTNFLARMRRHAYGTGSVLTTIWADARADVRLTGWIATDDARDERTLKRRSHYVTGCPICTNVHSGVSLAIVTGAAQQGFGPHADAPSHLDWPPPVTLLGRSGKP